jgi:phytoene/squalene synthetase
MALLGNSDSDRLRRLAYAAGRYMATVERLQHLARDIHAGQLPLPADLSERHGLTASRLRTDEDLPALAEVGRELLGEAETEWQRVRPMARAHEPLDPVLRLTAQAGRVARLLRRQAFQAHRQTPLPTPIGLLWSAWRGR